MNINFNRYFAVCERRQGLRIGFAVCGQRQGLRALDLRQLFEKSWTKTFLFGVGFFLGIVGNFDFCGLFLFLAQLYFSVIRSEHRNLQIYSQCTAYRRNLLNITAKPAIIAATTQKIPNTKGKFSPAFFKRRRRSRARSPCRRPQTANPPCRRIRKFFLFMNKRFFYGKNIRENVMLRKEAGCAVKISFFEIANFIASFFAAIVIFFLMGLIAANGEEIFESGSLIYFSQDGDRLNFFGETVEISKNDAEKILSFPKKSVDASIAVFPQTVQNFLQRLCGVLIKDFGDFFGKLTEYAISFALIGS